MRILLVAPAPRAAEHMPLSWAGLEHLGLGYLASVLRRANYEVMLADGMPPSDSPGGQSGLKLIGISVIFQRGLDLGLSQAYKAKKTYPKAHVCLGGHPPTLLARSLLESAPFVDSIVCGEGETAFLAIAEHLDRGLPLDDIPGVAVRKGRHVVHNGCVHWRGTLDELPFPARDMLSSRRYGVAAIQSSRGCPNHCSFCSVAAFTHTIGAPRWRGRSPSNVVEEFRALATSGHVSRIHFIDDNFIGPGESGRTRALDIARGIREANTGLRWKIDMRPDRVDRELVLALKDAGLTELFVGLESLSAKALGVMGKGLTPEQNLRALDILRDTKTPWVAGWIMFDPYTTMEEFADNFRAFREHVAGTGFAFPGVVNRLEVFSETAIARRLEREGRLRWNGFSLEYDFLDHRVALLWQYLNLCWEAVRPLSEKLNMLLKSFADAWRPPISLEAELALAKEDLRRIHEHLITRSVDAAASASELSVDWSWVHARESQVARAFDRVLRATPQIGPRSASS